MTTVMFVSLPIVGIQTPALDYLSLVICRFLVRKVPHRELIFGLGAVGADRLEGVSTDLNFWKNEPFVDDEKKSILEK